jgi:hypothetical protein
MDWPTLLDAEHPEVEPPAEPQVAPAPAGGIIATSMAKQPIVSGGLPPMDQMPPPVRVPHYPNQSYLDRNLAPEKKFTVDQLYELGRAAKIAEKNGVLTNELARALPAMAMVEGRPGNHGVNEGFSVPATPANIAKFKKLGLEVEDLRPFQDGGEDAVLPFSKAPVTIVNTVDGPNRLILTDSERQPREAALVMAAVLAHKVRQGMSADDVIKAYNGRGRAVVQTNDGPVQADTSVYLNKVKAAQAVLGHPKNRAFAQAINAGYQQGE